MSAAIVCGKRKEILTSAYPLYSKSFRCSYSASPAIRFYPSDNNRDYDSAAAGSAALAHLISIFPGMDKKVLERELCGDDLDSAIKSLTQLRLGSTADRTTNLPSQEEVNDRMTQERQKIVAEYEDKFRRFKEEMQQQLETMSQEITKLNQENTNLKRDVISIQNERQKDYDRMTQQLEESRKMEADYHKKFRAAEVENYALRLGKATQNNNNNNSMHSRHGY